MIDYKAKLSILFSQVSDEKESLIKQRSEIDKTINNLYHVIEYVTMPNVEKVVVFNKLRSFLTKRREIKERYAEVESIFEKLSRLNLSSIDERKDKRNCDYKLESYKSYQKLIKDINND